MRKGLDASGPTEITPPANWQTAENGVQFKYANGIEMFHVSDNGVTFTGTGGTLFVNRGKIQLTVGGVEKAKFVNKDDKPALTQQLDALEKKFLAQPKVTLYHSTDHKADFLACIRSRKKPITDVEVGARSVTVCHLTNLAYYHGQKIAWSPEREEFVGGTGNPQWLDVPQSPPWKV